MRLIECSECRRHLRSDEERCPFCEGLVSAPPPPALRRPLVRLGRAALFAFGATLTVGCGSAVPAYGVPPSDGGISSADGGLALDAGGPAPAYGAAPIDAGPGDDAGP